MELGVRSFLGCIALVCALVTGCSKTGGVAESRPLTNYFDGYRTGAVEVDVTGLPGGAKGSEEFLGYLEGQLKKNGVVEPLPVEQGAQLIVRVRNAPNTTGEDDRVLVDFIDARSRATIGQISITAEGLGEKGGANMRQVANSIVAYMRKNRRAPPTGSKTAGTVPSVLAPVVGAPSAGAVKNGACTTTCTPDASSALPMEDQTHVAEAFQPMLKDVRVCLDRISAQSIVPVAIVRFEANGGLSQLKIDVGGYDDLACVQDARSRTPTVRVSRAASVRCEYRCER